MVGAKKKKKHTSELPQVQKGEVWWVDSLSFADNPGSKSRPVLVISPDGEEMVSIMEITSQHPSDCPEYEIMDYLSAGLDHESFVKLRTRQISRKKLSRRIGKLVPEDMDGVLR